MSKRLYTIRLYRTHDKDLVTFLETHQFNIIKAIYCSLSAFCEGDMFVITIPPVRDKSYATEKKVITKQLSLDEKKDAKAIALLEMIKDGGKNNFLKNLLRLYLCYPISYDFLKDDVNMDMFDSMFRIFREKRRVADAGSITNKKREKKDNIIKQGRKTISEDDISSENDNERDVYEETEHYSVLDEPNNEKYEEAEHYSVLDESNKEQDNNLLDLFSSLM